MSTLTNAPVAQASSPVTVAQRSDGTAILSNPDGTVVSIQANGTREARPKGADGPFEVCKIQGALAIYNPVPGQTWFYGFSN